MNVGEQANHRHDTLSRKLETEMGENLTDVGEESQPVCAESNRKGLQIRHQGAEKSA